MVFLLLLQLFTIPPAQASEWNLNDVSYLYPLPAPSESLSILISPEENFLIPKSVYRKLPAMNVHETSETLYEKTRALAIRIDPCGINPETPGCEAQVRIVWQVIESDKNQNKKTLDAGMHTFYRLSQSQMQKLLGRLWKLKLANEKQNQPISTHLLPLQVHPALLANDHNPNFRKALHDTILAFCGQDNLIQATVAQFQGVFGSDLENADHTASWWEFSGIRKVKGKWSPIQISGLHGSLVPDRDESLQKIFNHAPEMDQTKTFPIGMKAQAVPLPPSTYGYRSSGAAPQMNTLTDIMEGVDESEAKDPNFLTNAVRIVRRQQNPKLETTKTLDCAQCHLTNATFTHLSSVAPKSLLSKIEASLPETYVNPNPNFYSLKNVSAEPKSTKILRAFGYWKALPALSDRVILESAETAEWLNQKMNSREGKNE